MDVALMGWIWLYSGIIALISGCMMIYGLWKRKKLSQRSMIICSLSFILFVGLGYFIWFIILPEFKKH